MGRSVDLDMTSRRRILVDVINTTTKDARLALALTVQGDGGEQQWYETRSLPVAPGLNKAVAFPLRAAEFKTRKTDWKFTARLPGLGGVGQIYFLVYTQRPGTFYLDNIEAEGEARKEPTGAPVPAPPSEAPAKKAPSPAVVNP